LYHLCHFDESFNLNLDLIFDIIKMGALVELSMKLSIALVLSFGLCNGQFEWIVYDRIDEIMEKMNAVTKENCHQKQPSELQLIEDVVHQPPTIDLLKKGIILANRTQLLHTRNMAHKNAILYSYQLQNLFDFDQPGLMYYYLHASADITGARSYLNQSGIIYDTDKAYAHWYKNYFNKTVPRYCKVCDLWVSTD
jgi:hypothetical protein